MRLPAVEVTQGEPQLATPVAHDGRPRPGRVCGACGTRMWSEPPHRPGLAVIRPGTLEDTSWIRPDAHLWTRSAQRWFIFPEGVPRYETEPGFVALLELGKGRRQ